MKFPGFLRVPWILAGEKAKNINLHGAVLHVIGDLVQSIGVAVAGLVIWIKNVRHPISHS